MKAIVKQTVKDIIDDKNLKLTEKELVLLVYLNNALCSYFGEDHSDVDCNDIAKDLKWDVKTVKGVVGSLVVKGVVGTYDTGTGYDVVNFVGQSDMRFYHFKSRLVTSSYKLRGEETEAEVEIRIPTNI